MMTDRVYVVAPSFYRAEHFAYINNIPKHKMHYVYDETRLYGVDDVTLYILSESYRHPKFAEILEAATTRRINIVFVPEGDKLP
jgi:hypothetical protein